MSQSPEPVEAPSLFWRSLGSSHQKDLAVYGFENIKRRQAFRYFNWSWRWRSIRNSEQGRFLLRNTPLSSTLRSIVTPALLSDAAWEGAPLGRGDRLLYTYAVRLLWEYATRHGEAGVLKLEEPRLGNPLPVHWRGRLISQDLANSALEVKAMVRGLQGEAPRRILEIGAGYGRTAYALLSLYPDAEYTIVDIEPALSISRWYLGQLFPGRRLTFLDGAALDPTQVPASSLGLSISSLQEMTPEQIDFYLKLLDRSVKGGTVYLKQWEDWYNPDDKVRIRFGQYPIPPGWRPVFREVAPVQTRFTQAVWKVPQ